MMQYEQNILDILRTADKPLLKREIAERIPGGQEYRNYLNIGAAVSKPYRAGALDRVQIGRQHNMYAYSIAEHPRIEAGYTWSDDLGPVRVMAVAEGYAMCRRPGVMPFIMAVTAIAKENHEP